MDLKQGHILIVWWKGVQRFSVTLSYIFPRSNGSVSINSVFAGTFQNITTMNNENDCVWKQIVDYLCNTYKDL